LLLGGRTLSLPISALLPLSLPTELCHVYDPTSTVSASIHSSFLLLKIETGWNRNLRDTIHYHTVHHLYPASLTRKSSPEVSKEAVFKCHVQVILFLLNFTKIILYK
jgi:hypothetical protein